MTILPRETVLGNIRDERERQIEKWGEQRHPDGTGPTKMVAGIPFAEFALWAKAKCEARAGGDETWESILLEEVGEAIVETDLVALRKELVQVCAVGVAWIEDIDARLAGA